MEKGRLIVIEGACDGIGKTTQYELLKQKLEFEGEQIAYHHFPSYNTYHGAPVEKYLAGEQGIQVNFRRILLMLYMQQTGRLLGILN
ncbi:MAG: hypothetical protein IJA94_00790 [Bacilli bacterium]|nr:hypothetical protein [Bacilli bacterium]